MYAISLCCNKVSVLHILEAIQSKFWKVFILNFRCHSHYNQMKIRGNSGGFQAKFRRISGGSQMVFRGVFCVFSAWGFSGGFPMKFQSSFRGFSDYFQEVFSTSESDTPQNVFRA